MLIPDVVARWSVKFITFEQKEFCEQYVPTMRGSGLNGSASVQRAMDGRK